MSRQDSKQIEDVKVMLLKGEKGDKGDGSYDDTELRTAIENEFVDRGRADATMKLEIDALEDGLNAETTARQNADDTLQSNINSEASTRAGADSDLNSAIAVERARIDQLIAPSGTAPNPAEIIDARIGANGVTYTDLGDAIRTQVGELKNDLSMEQDEGLFHKYITWEHGGIDGATGENNNEGSLVRSRTPDYLLCADYEKITNDTSNWAYVIYYDADKTYKFTDALLAGSSVTIRKNYVYFRLDLRAGIDLTYKIRAYQNVRYEDIKGNIHENRYEQIYFQADKGVIEENTSNGKVYFHADEAVIVRYGINGVPKTSRTISMSALATELNVSLVTSTKGIFNCIAIDNGYALAYDTSSKTFVLIDRYSLENEHIPLIVQNGGFVTYANSYFIKKMSNNDEDAIIPSYWDSAINDAETSINDALSSDANSASFAFVTDTHIGDNAGYSGLMMDKVMKDCHIPICFHGGDAVSGYGIVSKDNIIADMDKDFAQFADVESRCLRVIGNHDPVYGISANYDRNLSNGEINHYYHGIDREKDLQIYGDERGYFYRDIPKDKMRYIVLDMMYYESQIDADNLVIGANKMYYYKFGAVQLDWFADVLANTPEGYGVVVCSHMTPVAISELQTLSSDWVGSVPADYLQARRICSAYASKTEYVFNGSIAGDLVPETYDINVDFSNARGDFVCWIGGHTHKDYMMTLDNIKFVGTANDSKARSSNASTYAPYKAVGTDTEQIIDFFCIDKTNKTVKVVRLGAYLVLNGKVRTFNY